MQEWQVSGRVREGVVKEEVKCWRRGVKKQIYHELKLNLFTLFLRLFTFSQVHRNAQLTLLLVFH